jgi:hypothetical protein
MAGVTAMANPRTTDPRPLWFLRSLADADTHRGSYSTVTRSVHSDCGVEFVPRALPLGGPALPGRPLDPAQVCPQCYRARNAR